MAVRSDEWQYGEEEDEEGGEEEEVVEGAETRFWIWQCMMTKEGEEKGRNKSIWSGEVWEGSRVGGDKSRLVHLCCNLAIYFT